MQRRSWRQFDPWLLACTLALIGYGLVVLRSATMLADQSVSTQLLIQGAYAVLGIAAMVGMSFFDYRLLGTFSIALYAVMVALLGLVLIAGNEAYGATRWLGAGRASFQPSELAKLVVIICLARYLAGRQHEISHPKTLLVSFAIVAVPVALVYRQPDLGTTLVLLAIWMGMTFGAGAPLRWLLGALLVPLLGFPIVWRLLKEYMRERLLTFVAPERDPLGAGYNVIQARISVGSGGWTGKGLGNGTQTQLNFLRVQHSDFIFAVLGEELGFIGALLLLALFGALFARCLRVALHSRDAFGRLLAIGVTSMLLFQVFINIGMNIGLVPVTGIPLPFVSAGGSSLVTVFVSLGVLQSVLVHAQARRYDTRPSVSVPASLRVRRSRFPVRLSSAAFSRAGAVRAAERLGATR
jgi:rod shape determining protein RodA